MPRGQGRRGFPCILIPLQLDLSEPYRLSRDRVRRDGDRNALLQHAPSAERPERQEHEHDQARVTHARQPHPLDLCEPRPGEERVRRCDGEERWPEGEGDQGWRGQAEGQREEEGEDEREEDAATRCARESVRLKRGK